MCPFDERTIWHESWQRWLHPLPEHDRAISFLESEEAPEV